MENEDVVLTVEMEALQHKIKQSFDYESDFLNLLLPFLIKLGWEKDVRSLIESLPHFAEKLTLTEFRNLMVNLGFKSEQKDCCLIKVSPHQLPCIFVTSNNQSMLIEKIIVTNVSKEVVVLDGKSGNKKTLTAHQIINLHGTAYFFSKIQKADEFTGENWFWFVFKRFKFIIGQIFLINLLYSVLATSIPVFIMIIYDKIIPSESISMLLNFSLGVWIVLFSMYVISSLKNKMIAYIAVRLDKAIAITTIKHIIELPPSYTENATLNNQIARIKDFDNVREFFTSPMVMLFFELPLSIVFLMVVMYMGGWLMLVPIILIAVFFAVFVGGRALISEIVKLQSQDGAIKQGFVTETFSNMRWVKSSGAIDVCINKFDEVLTNIAKYSFKAQVVNHILSSVADYLMLLSAMLVMGFGTFLTMDNKLSSGSLIAVMLLTWKIVDPLKVFIVSLPTIEQVINSIKQINNLIRLPVETTRTDLVKMLSVNKIEFQRVSFRYASQENLSLLGISFNLETGGINCIAGKNGSGKSTIVKLILALYHVQSGIIKINNMNINQIDPVTLRKSIAYMPQVNNLFFGSIKQNLLLANPIATQAEIKQAAVLAGVHDDIMKLKNNYDTPLGDQSIIRLSSSFIQKLILARVYLKKAKIFIFDNPYISENRVEEQKFIDTLHHLKKNNIVVIITSKLSYLEIADQIIYLKSGQIAAAGHPSQVLSGILEEYGVRK